MHPNPNGIEWTDESFDKFFSDIYNKEKSDTIELIQLRQKLFDSEYDK